MDSNDERIPRIIAMAATLAACGLLGAFNGCTVDVWTITQSSIGLAVGGLLGLAFGTVACAIAWRRSISIGGTMRSWAIYGALWTASAGLALAASRAMWLPENRIRFQLPVRFDKANTATGVFRAKVTGPHFVQVDLERRAPADRLDAFVNDPSNEVGEGRSNPERPAITWQVFGVPETKIRRYWRGQGWGDTVTLEIGEFPAVAGQSYTVTATVSKPARWAQVLNPRLQVAISPVLWTYYYVGAIVLLVSFMVASGIAVGCLFAAWSAWAAHRGSEPHSN